MSDPRYYKRRGSGDGGAPYSQLERDEKELRESLSPWQRLWAFLNRPIRLRAPKPKQAAPPVGMLKMLPRVLKEYPPKPTLLGLDDWEYSRKAHNTFRYTYRSFSRSNLPTAAQDQINLFNTLATLAPLGVINVREVAKRAIGIIDGYSDTP